MLSTLENQFHVPSYILRILKNYLKDRSMLTIEIMSRLAPGSPKYDFWNPSYDSLLRLDMPEESRLVDYADNVVAFVAERSVEQAQSRFGILMSRVNGRMTAQTKVVIQTRKRILTLYPISICELIIESKPAVKYLRIT